MTVFRIKTGDMETYNLFHNKGSNQLTVDHLIQYENDIKIGAPVLLLFGGDGTPWKNGLAGLGKITSKPIDYGYEKAGNGSYYKLNLEITVRLKEHLAKGDFVRYPQTFDSGVGPSTKGERNQALGEINNDVITSAICRAVLDKEPEHEVALRELFGNSIIDNALDKVEVLVPANNDLFEYKNLDDLINLENMDFAKELAIILKNNPYITQEIIEDLQDKEFCSTYLKTYFPILFKIDPAIEIEELKKIAKYNTERQKYYYEIFEIKGNSYLITNDWYRTRSKNVQCIIEWLKQFYPTEIKIKGKTSFSTKNFSVFAKRYIKSLLAKPFTILTGNSGTGKTKIATEFATYLGKIDQGNAKSEEEKQKIVNKLIIPVGADWTDNTKILGFYNPLEKKYQSTPILDFILLAQKNQNIPFFLILDEMNLSYVERYFSDFLSAMESGEPIPLYKRSADDNSSVPERIVLPDNLFVTGTVNIDETTYMFSPKVLDRANVIEFIPKPEDILDNFAEESSKDDIIPVDDGSAEGFLDLSRTIRKSKVISEKAKITKEIMEKIIAILADSDFEFAFRTAKEIRLYINAAEQLANNAGEALEEKKYIDLVDEQLVQKILPKIHGNRNQIGLLLKNLYDFCNSKTIKIKDEETGEDKEISGYELELSRKKIARMQRKLETSQFASFI